MDEIGFNKVINEYLKGNSLVLFFGGTILTTRYPTNITFDSSRLILSNTNIYMTLIKI